MQIKRVDSYQDSRFSETTLLQHGCFLADDLPYEVEIITNSEAVVRGADCRIYHRIIEEFRYYAPHIIRYYTEDRSLIEAYPARPQFRISLDQIQPSQFYVDQDKIQAIKTFVKTPEDIVIQVLPYKGRYISLDGHTRMYYAVMNGWETVYAVEESSDAWVYTFAEEAARREIQTPGDMRLVTHEEYEIKWNQFCDSLFERAGETDGKD